MTDTLDRRVNAFRPDLADLALKDHVKVPRYEIGYAARVNTPTAPVRRDPRPDAPLDTEALYGQVVTIFDENEGWAWAQLQEDNYVGYLPSNCLSQKNQRATHQVTAQSAHIFPAPDIKAPPLMALPLMSQIEIDKPVGDFFALQSAGYIHKAQTCEIDKYETDFVAVAERFLNTPYLWGGKSTHGIDCSGLVQLAMSAAGMKVPRDSDMQCTTIGSPLDEPASLNALQRGDLVFWKGHVGIMKDAENLLHANAYHMRTAVEPVSQASKRIADSDSEIIAIRRPESD